MACFPRFLRVNSKSSFTPTIDENTETLFSANDNPVQIGRYVRCEEIPLFTPESSYRLIQAKPEQPQQQKQQNDQQQQQQPNKPVTNQNNKNNISNGIISNNTNKNIIFRKKFISNKNSNYNSNSNNNINNNLNNSFNHNTNTYTKLKPVKERRPTALPIEQLTPTIADDESINQLYDEIDGNNSDSNSHPHTLNTSSIENVNFFIGGHEGEDAISDSISFGYEKISIPTNDIGNNREQATFKQESANSIGHTIIPSSKSLPKLSSHKQQQRPPPRATSAQNRRKETVENLTIPPPPPLPPKILTTAESTTSMASIRSANAKRHTNAHRNLNERNSRNNFDYNSKTYLEFGFENLSKYEKNSYSDVKSHNCDFLATTGSHGNSFNGQDSGVEDSSSTPKDSNVSDEPASHRIEGGLIYTRANVPINRTETQIVYIRKDEATRDLIRAAIENNDFLHNYMDKERKEMVIDAMSPAYYDKDAFIIRENDEGSEIFVSEDGYFDVIKNEKIIGSFGPATVFGELAILYNAKRYASIKAATYARVWKIDRDTFRKIMIISGSKERQENLNFLKSAPFLKDLTNDVLDKVVDLLQRKFYETNTCIVREGEVGNEFFIIRGGTVTIKKKNFDGVERTVARRKRGEYFGEQALVNADCRQASVYADAPGTEVLKLDRETFNSYLGTIPQLREKPQNDDVEEECDSNRKSEFDNEYAHIELKDLKKIATLGAGAFGRVDLVSHEENIFALKIIKKIDIIKQDQIEHIYSEKHVMMKCRTSPFIIELYKTYRNEKFVYFLMEACMGGDVWTVMSHRRFFDEKTARFIAGCVVEAFDFLHSHNIIYRDLKPENLMLTTDGYCKLVDFGFAKHIPPNQKTNTFAGTPEYVAPEIILDRGHDRAVDYWALGILIYELLVGKTPFREQNQIKIYQKILGGIDVIQMPSKIPKSAQSLIKHLCKQLPAERLGYQRKGIQDIKKHSWFDSLDWQRLKKKQISSPIKRPIISSTDLQYFGPPGVDNDHDPPDETSGWDNDF